MTVIYEHPITEHAKWLKKVEVTYSKIESLIKSRKQHVFANIIFLIIELETLVSGQENRIDIQKVLNKKRNFTSTDCLIYIFEVYFCNGNNFRNC